MEEETEKAYQGVGALDTLSDVAAQQSAELEEKLPQTTKPLPVTPPSTSGRQSAPLVPLAPAQKRSRSQSQDVSKTLGPSASGVQKVRGSGQQPAQANVSETQQRRGSSSDREIRQRRSAPEQRLALERELRSSKSAPDLGATALAAIRGIQAGTLQLDRRMRSKIAAAAKRVLEARELKRKASRDNLAAGAAGGSSGEAQQQQRDTAADPVHTPQGSSAPPQLVSSPPMEGGRGSWMPLPQSLATAAAIARGESLSLPRQGNSPTAAAAQAASETGSTAGSPSKFHRPVPAPSMQAGGAGCAPYRPFTVTTGVPRFAQGTRGVGPMEPSTPPALFNWEQARTATSAPASRTSSLVLPTSTLQLPAHTEVP